MQQIKQQFLEGWNHPLLKWDWRLMVGMFSLKMAFIIPLLIASLLYAPHEPDYTFRRILTVAILSLCFPHCLKWGLDWFKWIATGQCLREFLDLLP